MRWSPDKDIVLFNEVVIDLYMLTTVDCFFINVLTSLYIILPLGETKLKNIHMQNLKQ